MMTLKERLEAYKTIANENRLHILLEMSKRKDGLPFEKLCKELSLNPNTLDYHLEKLSNVGLIQNVSRPPLTKRTRYAMTLYRDSSKLKKPLENRRYYSYYKITRFGREVLKKLGIR